MNSGDDNPYATPAPCEVQTVARQSTIAASLLRAVGLGITGYATILIAKMVMDWTGQTPVTNDYFHGLGVLLGAVFASSELLYVRRLASLNAARRVAITSVIAFMSVQLTSIFVESMGWGPQTYHEAASYDSRPLTIALILLYTFCMLVARLILHCIPATNPKQNLPA